jgi:hypothetical protein
MQMPSKNSALPLVVEQVTNNTTTWVGHRKSDNNTLISGQTFIAPKEADLDKIEVFSSVVTQPGKVVMTVHKFDQQQKSWGPALGSASLELNKTDSDKWVGFHIPGLHLNSGQAYGFRLESATALIGVGEAAGSHHHPPFVNGQEWKFTNKDEKGHSFSYFSLAFKVGLRA